MRVIEDQAGTADLQTVRGATQRALGERSVVTAGVALIPDRPQCRFPDLQTWVRKQVVRESRTILGRVEKA